MNQNRNNFLISRIEVDTKLIYGLKWELTQNVETKPRRIFLLVDWWQRPKRKWFSDFKDWGRHKISNISTFASTILTRWNLMHFTDASLTIQNQTIPTTNKQRIINKNHIHKPRFSTKINLKIMISLKFSILHNQKLIRNEEKSKFMKLI